MRPQDALPSLLSAERILTPAGLQELELMCGALLQTDDDSDDMDDVGDD